MTEDRSNNQSESGDLLSEFQHKFNIYFGNTENIL